MSISCSSNSYNEHSGILLEDTPSSYKEGYIDSCASGENIAGNFMTRFKRSGEYVNDASYKQAWDKGYEYCKNQLEKDRKVDRMVHH